MISVRLQPHARKHIHKLADQLTEPDSVLDVYFIAGADDFLIHVATPDTEALRNFVVDNLSSHPAVASTETILIFEHVRRRGST